MELTVASWLVSEEASPARRLASSEADPGSLAAATRMRAYVSLDRAAAVLEHETLRRRAARKFGAELSGWFWTAHGLEQATRPTVSRPDERPPPDSRSLAPRSEEKFVPVPEPYLNSRASRTHRSMMPLSLTRSSSTPWMKQACGCGRS